MKRFFEINKKTDHLLEVVSLVVMITLIYWPPALYQIIFLASLYLFFNILRERVDSTAWQVSVCPISSRWFNE